jgi:sulfonate transport system ATP-binding protein
LSGLEIHGLCKQYRIKDRCVCAIQDIEMQIASGEFVTVVGKSGCGKTTLLRLICGIETADQGHARVTQGNGNTVNQRISIVFQEPRLMPWLTVRQNMAFGLSNAKNQSEVDTVVNSFLQILGLTAFQDAYPNQISGGMAQRTALGRTLCYDPDIILMDEPFGALDAFTRRKLQQELVDIFLAHQKTIVFVTHDVDEAVLLGQRVLVMENGCVVSTLTNDLPYPRNILSPKLLFMREEIFSSIMASQ